MANVGVYSYISSSTSSELLYFVQKILLFKDDIAARGHAFCKGLILPVQSGTRQSLRSEGKYFSCQYPWNCWYLYFDWCPHHRLRDRRQPGCKERRSSKGVLSTYWAGFRGDFKGNFLSLTMFEEVLLTPNPLVLSPFYSDRISLYFWVRSSKSLRWTRFLSKSFGLSSFLLAGEVFLYFSDIMARNASVGMSSSFGRRWFPDYSHRARGVRSHIACMASTF